MSYALYITSKSVLCTRYSGKKCLIGSLSVLSEVQEDCPNTAPEEYFDELQKHVSDSTSRRALRAKLLLK